VRSATHTRAILSHIQTIVIPPSVNLPHADQAFNEDGTLKDPKMQARVEKLGRQLIETIAQLKK
jgi:NAD(P)H-dependent FMN reductase